MIAMKTAKLLKKIKFTFLLKKTAEDFTKNSSNQTIKIKG